MRAFGNDTQTAREEHTRLCDELFNMMMKGLEGSPCYNDLLEAVEQLETEYGFAN